MTSSISKPDAKIATDIGSKNTTKNRNSTAGVTWATGTCPAWLYLTVVYKLKTICCLRYTLWFVKYTILSYLVCLHKTFDLNLYE